MSRKRDDEIAAKLDKIIELLTPKLAKNSLSAGGTLVSSGSITVSPGLSSYESLLQRVVALEAFRARMEGR